MNRLHFILLIVLELESSKSNKLLISKKKSIQNFKIKMMTLFPNKKVMKNQYKVRIFSFKDKILLSMQSQVELRLPSRIVGERLTLSLRTVDIVMKQRIQVQSPKLLINYNPIHKCSLITLVLTKNKQLVDKYLKI